MTQIVSTMIVVLFVFSTLPFVSTTDSTAELRDAINMVQLLQQSDTPSHLSFKSIFKSTIISLQSAADIHTIFTQQHTQEQEDTQLTVSSRLPFLLPSFYEINPTIAYQQTLSILSNEIYHSISIPPEIPPPDII